MASVAIVNVYDDENRGSAALNLAAIELVRREDPGSTIGLVTIRDFDPARRDDGFRHTLAEHPDVAVLPPLVGRASIGAGALTAIPAELVAPWSSGRGLSSETAEFLDSVDLVVSRGGVVYYCRQGWGELAGLLRRTSPVRWAQHHRIPTVLLGLHVGRVHGTVARRSIGNQLGSAQSLFPRGPLSDARARRLAPLARASRLPDSVFALDLHVPSTTEPRAGAGRLLLVVSEAVRSHLGHVNALVDQLVAGGDVSHVTVSVQVSDVDSDRSIAEDITAQLGGDTEILDDDLSPRQLVEQYSTYDLVVSSRLHAAVFGLLGGVPSFPIEVSDDRKATDVFSEIDLEHLVLSLDQPGSWPTVVRAGIEDGGAHIDAAVERARDRYRGSRLAC